MEPANSWSLRLQAARKALRISRSELAAKARVSVQTVKAYELGLRHPSRLFLTAILDALKMERSTRNEILESAGFAPDGRHLGPDRSPNYMFTLDQALEYIEGLPWPAFIFNDVIEVVVANQTAQKLWGVDLEREFLTPIERNMLGISTLPRFGDKVENWDELIKVGISVFKGHHLGAETLEGTSLYFKEILDRFVKGNPAYAVRFAALWQEAEPHEPKVRWEYPVQWCEPGIGPIAFRGIATTANDPDGLAFNDWIPVGAESWANMAATLACRS
jgi:transcriptional regulator with XRE-family HTH domain